MRFQFGFFYNYQIEFKYKCFMIYQLLHYINQNITIKNNNNVYNRLTMTICASAPWIYNILEYFFLYSVQAMLVVFACYKLLEKGFVCTIHTNRRHFLWTPLAAARAQLLKNQFVIRGVHILFTIWITI